MPYLNDAWVRLHTPVKLALGCCLAFFLWSGTVHASTPVSLALQVDVGFQATFREGDWTPVQVTIQNNGANFTGTLAVSTISGPRFTTTVGEVSTWSSERPITLPRGLQKQVTLYIPFSMGNLIPTGVIATVRDVQGNKVAEQVQKKGLAIASRNLFVGL